ncbi:Fe-S oxidoreductase [Raphidocelis subcapitata]|uniref:Fe-S oxidoreductase n=1 Tax=Raphidocelis subcapitata TaxID=307507 RepID=A0A2V0PD50_9CHLO|nr:Fe-S oxidoreductase [Raphidocelis subcapitata]|eukprot:GBF96882.1 Fe-S oxidoreductase [Raphidocelis subcapitata]
MTQMMAGATHWRAAGTSGRSLAAPRAPPRAPLPPPPRAAPDGGAAAAPAARPLQRGEQEQQRQQQQQRTSLVPETLETMESDDELQAALAALAAKGQAALTREERRARQRSLDGLGVPSFARVCADRGVAPLVRGQARILQLNTGLYCNQACTHCHVESSPKRTEAMDAATAGRCLELLAAAPGVHTLDLTGGAPELTPQFRRLVSEARALRPELTIIDRCNLTVLLEPGQEDLAAFLAAHRVRVVASLPCYSQSNVDGQRGAGVFDRSIAGLRALNAAGYGAEGSGLALDLVYNPGGAFLAPSREKLEPAYKQELSEAYGITFNSLLCLNNMPIKRFADWLLRRDALEAYMQALLDAFNPAAGSGLMCRDTVSVAWDGRVFDCDFNQQLDIPAAAGSSRAAAAAGSAAAAAGEGAGPSGGGGGGGRGRGFSVFEVSSLDDLTGRPIAVDNHCFGCTAGSGSGCQGATA